MEQERSRLEDECRRRDRQLVRAQSQQAQSKELAEFLGSEGFVVLAVSVNSGTL